MRQAKRGMVAMPSRYQFFDLTSPSFCGDVISHGFFSGGLSLQAGRKVKGVSILLTGTPVRI